jgi:DNA-binding response OmpR family regulator
MVGIAGNDVALSGLILHRLAHAAGFESRIADDDCISHCAALLLVQSSLDRMCTDLKKLRRTGFTRPILCVGTTNDHQTLALAIAAGADDYVAIPERLDEIPLRIVALMRHQSRTMLRVSEATSRQSAADVANPSDEPALPGSRPTDFALDANQRTLSYDGVTITLTASEMQIVEYLKSHAHTWVTATSLMEHVFGYGSHADTTLIRVHVSSLRKKLGAHARVLESRRTLGYRWRT